MSTYQQTGIAYKVLTADGGATHAYNDFHWPLPEGRKYGAWVKPIQGKLVACKNGYHVCGRAGVIEWLNARIFKCEWRGGFIWKDKNKVRVVREARLVRELKTWNKRTQRLLAADCAEHVLHLYEAKYPGDSRVRNCIEIARKVARSELPVSKLDAAGAAARDASWDAAGAAARDVAWAAAGAAAGAAARDASWAAARDAAGAAARDASWAAARDAAGAAARDVARDAAGAWAAAGAAARDAAGAAEQRWQSRRLWEYLNGDRT